MIPTPILRRLFSTLAIIAIAGFSTGLYYKADATEWKVSAAEERLTQARFIQQCEREKPSDCAHNGYVTMLESFEDAARQSDAVAFWWFLAGWLSAAVTVGYLVFAWIATGSPFGAKRNSTKG